MSIASLCTKHTVQIYKLTEGTGEAGGVTRSYPTTPSFTLTGFMQTDDPEENPTFGQYQFQLQYDFFTTSNPGLSAGDKAVFNGQNLSVRGVENELSLGRLWKTKLSMGDQ